MYAAGGANGFLARQAAAQRNPPRWAFTLLLVIAACASRPYEPSEPTKAAFLERSISQTQGPVRVTVAVPDGAETQSLFGLSLYDQGIQPVWIKIQNSGPAAVRLAIWSIDPDYFSPAEVSWANQRGFGNEDRARMERWFFDTAMRRRVPSGASRSGFVYTHLMPGTKGFNLDVFATGGALNFTFFVPIPGFTADYMTVDFENLYAPEEVINLAPDDLPAIRRVVASLPCCSEDASGTRAGDPFNVLLVGSGIAVRRMLLRAVWRETAADSAETSTAHAHRYRGRPPDGTFHKARADGGERRELRLWLAPYRYGSEWVWLGQVSHDLSESTQDPNDHVTDPDVDSARNYLLQEAWYSQSLVRAGLIDGVRPATQDAPARSFTGGTYFSDGLRIVLFLSESPVALGDTVIVPWRQMRR